MDLSFRKEADWPTDPLQWVYESEGIIILDAIDIDIFFPWVPAGGRIGSLTDPTQAGFFEKPTFLSDCMWLYV